MAVGITSHLVENLNVFCGLPLFELGISSVAWPLAEALEIAEAAAERGYSVIGGEIYELDGDGKPIYAGTSWSVDKKNLTPEAGLRTMKSFIARCDHASGQGWLENRYFDLVISSASNGKELTAGIVITPLLISHAIMKCDVTIVSPVADTSIRVSIGIKEWISFAKLIASPEEFGGSASVLFHADESHLFTGLLFIFSATRFLGQILVSAEFIRRDCDGRKYAGDSYFLISQTSISDIQRMMINIVERDSDDTFKLMGTWKLPLAVA
jgi:hypothetical protein